MPVVQNFWSRHEWPGALRPCSLYPTRAAVGCKQVHSETGQTEYTGEVVELAECLSRLGAGGQCLISGHTFQRIFGHLQACTQSSDMPAVPALLFSADGPESRTIAFYSPGVPGNKLPYLPACECPANPIQHSWQAISGSCTCGHHCITSSALQMHGDELLA